jgi:hypothetical protein
LLEQGHLGLIDAPADVLAVLFGLAKLHLDGEERHRAEDLERWYFAEAKLSA